MPIQDKRGRIQSLPNGVNADNKIWKELDSETKSTMRPRFNEIKDFRLTKGWLKKNHMEFFTHLQESLTSLNTFKKAVNEFKKVLDKAGLASLKKEYFQIYKQLDAESKRETEEGDLSEKQKRDFLCQETIRKKRDELGQKAFTEPINRNDLLGYVWLSLNTLMPPLRGEYANCHIALSKKEMTVLNEKKENYIFPIDLKASPEARKWKVRVNYDKMTNRDKRKASSQGEDYKPATFEFDTDIARELSHTDLKLNDVINKSLIALPRKYVLTTINDVNRPIGANIYKLSEYVFGRKGISAMAFRLSYVNAYANVPREKELSVAKQRQIATLMRHTFQTAQSFYKKLARLIPCKESDIKGQVEEIDEDVEQNKPIKPKQVHFEKPEKKVLEKAEGVVNFDYKKYAKNYYKTDAGKSAIKKANQKYLSDPTNKLKQIARNQINYYNQTGGSPTPKTAQKYRLEKVNGKWITNL